MKQTLTEQDVVISEVEDTRRDEQVSDPEERQLGMSMLAKTALGVFVIVALIISVSNVMKFNRKQEEEAAYRELIESVDKENGQLQHLLNSPMNDEYIARLAQERLGLSFPDEQKFYNNLND